MFSHVRCKEKAGIGLVDRITFRSREVDKVLAVFQHLCTAGLFTCFVGKMGRCDCGTRCNRIDPDIRVDQPHGHILGQCIDRAFRGCIGCSAKRPVSIYRRDVDNASLVFGKKYLQGFPDETEGPEYIGLIDMFQPLIIGFIDHLLLADCRVVDDNVQVTIGIKCSLNDLLHILQVFIICDNTGHIITLVADTLNCIVQLFLSSCGHDDFCAFFCKKLRHGISHSITCSGNNGYFPIQHLCLHSLVLHLSVNLNWFIMIGLSLLANQLFS